MTAGTAGNPITVSRSRAATCTICSVEGRWVETGDGVLARRHDELDLTTGLVLGTRRALVVDTRGDERQGAELAAAVRGVTGLPLVVVLTHAHFDHCFGTAAFAGAPVYAQSGCAAAIMATAVAQRATWTSYYRGRGDDATADALAATGPPVPDRPVCTRPGDRHAVDLGGREIVLVHPGPAHTDHDLAVHVPDAGVLFAGDLLESGAPPSYGPDSHPDRWAGAVATLRELGASVLVPGHGDPMDRDAVAVQHAEIDAVGALYRLVAAGHLSPDTAEVRSPHPDVPWPVH